MHYARVATKTLCLMFAATIFSAAQTAPTPQQPDAMDLLKSVELAYGAINTYSAKVTETTSMEGSGAQTDMETAVTVTADSTGKFRVESTGITGMVLVYDGNATWMYMPMAKSYSKLPLSGGSPSTGAEAMGGMFGGANALEAYKNVSKGVKEARIVRSEKLHVNGADADCWVVSLEYEAMPEEASAAAEAGGVSLKDFELGKTLWVDKNRFLVYREDSKMKMTMPNANAPTNMKQTSNVQSFMINDPVSPEVFTFTPPPGAKEMDESKFIPKTSQGPQTKN